MHLSWGQGGEPQILPDWIFVVKKGGIEATSEKQSCRGFTLLGKATHFDKWRGEVICAPLQKNLQRNMGDAYQRATRLGPCVIFVIRTQQDLCEYLLNVHVQLLSCPGCCFFLHLLPEHFTRWSDSLWSRLWAEGPAAARHFVKFSSAVSESKEEHFGRNVLVGTH